MKRKVALCVAEKPTVARAVAEFLSRGNSRKVRKCHSLNLTIVFVCSVSISIEVQPHI